MKFYEGKSTGNLWKLYLKDGEWYREQSAPNGIVIKESDFGCEDWDDCLADAMKNGMVCEPNLKPWDFFG